MKSEKTVIDTSAWVEYFAGTKKGAKVRSTLSSSVILTPAIVIAELSHFYRKNNQTPLWETQRKPFLEVNTMVYPLEVDLADRGGFIKKIKREKDPSFGLADGIIIATAEHAQANILTADHHLQGTNTILL